MLYYSLKKLRVAQGIRPIYEFLDCFRHSLVANVVIISYDKAV